MTDQPLYDNRVTLKHTPKELQRQAGIMVSAPYQPADNEPLRVEIEREGPSLNTVTTVTWAPASDWKPVARKQLTTVIGQIDLIVEELSIHRQRLIEQRKNL